VKDSVPRRSGPCPESRWLWAISFGALGALLCGPWAQANMGRLDTDPSIDGQVLPKQETTVAIVGETLDIRFEHGYLTRKPEGDSRGTAPHAFVTARYELVNPTDNPVDLDLAFPVVAGDLRRAGDADGPGSRRPARFDERPADAPKGVAFRVTWRGKPVAHESVTAEDLMRGDLPAWREAILAWLKADPVIAELLGKARVADQEREGFRKHLATAKGFSQRQAMDLSNYLLAGGVPSLPDRWPDGYVCSLFHRLNPKAPTRIAAAFEKWQVDVQHIDPHSGKLGDAEGLLNGRGGLPLDRRISFAIFRIALAPREKASLQVDYDHLLNADFWRLVRDDGPDDAPDYQFQYILKTANLWGQFGPIDLRVRVPEHLKAAFSLPLRYERLDDGFLVFTARLSRPQANLLVGLSPRLKKADVPGPADAPTPRACLGWLRRFNEDPRGPWADDYLSEFASRLEVLKGCGEYEPYVRSGKGADMATPAEWAFLTSQTPLGLYRRLAEEYRETNGGHRAALMLLDLKYRDAKIDEASYPAIEADARRFIEDRPTGWVTPNVRYLLAMCLLRRDVAVAEAAFRSAAAPRAQWHVREQAEWFAALLRKAGPEDAPLLKAWAECEIRNGLRPDWMRRESWMREYVFPINQSQGLDEYWRAYSAHRERPLAYDLLKRLCLEMDRTRHSPARAEKRAALSELYRRAEREEKDDKALRDIRWRALGRLSDIGVGEATEVVRDALYGKDPALRPTAIQMLPSMADRAKATAVLLSLAEGSDAKLAKEATLALGGMEDRAAVPHLIKLLRHADLSTAERAGGLLRRLTRRPFSIELRGSPEQREKAIQLWEQWWEDTRPRLPM